MPTETTSARLEEGGGRPGGRAVYFNVRHAGSPQLRSQNVMEEEFTPQPVMPHYSENLLTKIGEPFVWYHIIAPKTTRDKKTRTYGGVGWDGGGGHGMNPRDPEWSTII